MKEENKIVLSETEIIEIGAKHSKAGQFHREFTESGWIEAVREIENRIVKALAENT